MHNLKLKKIFEINVGLISCALGIALFFQPNNFITGGTSGLAILINNIFPVINQAVALYVVNIALLLLGLIFLGKDYFIKTIYAGLALPTFVTIITYILKWTNLMDQFSSFGIDWITVGLGAVLLGYGIGLNIKNGGSTGGVDIIQSIMNKYFKVSFTASNVVVNSIIILGGYFIHKDLVAVFSAIIFLYLSGYIIDSVTFGGFSRRAVYIKTVKPEEVKNKILNDLCRGCTSVDVHGGYSKEPGELLLCVCLSREYLTLRDMIEKTDPKAFIFVTRATEVKGDGFSHLTDEKVEALKNMKQKKEE